MNQPNNKARKENKTMSVQVKTVVDSKRGCGWRKPGGLYLRTEPGLLAPCGKLPMELTICPCCGAGVKPTRGWTWINPKLLFKDRECEITGRPVIKTRRTACKLCPLDKPAEKAGLLWIGGSFYKEPSDWTSEATSQGVSRRIHALPKGFVPGETWVMVAHRQAIAKTCPKCQNSHTQGNVDKSLCDECKGTGTVKVPAVFHMFQPSAVEYVVTGKESEEKLERLVKRGITPVKVRKDGELPLED